jgi:hypothetical protein
MKIASRAKTWAFVAMMLIAAGLYWIWKQTTEVQRLRDEVAALKTDAIREQREPTASELFALRAKCNVCGEKILNDKPVGANLTQSQVSHYDAKTGHCYVEVTVLPIDPSEAGPLRAIQPLPLRWSERAATGFPEERQEQATDWHGFRERYLWI